MSTVPIKVLIIDDEPPIRKLLRMGLSTQGYDVLEASNGKIALEKLAEGPALIILDLGLPDIQGHELLRMIRLKKAARMLSEGTENVTQVMYQVGYRNLSFFARTFKHSFGVNPSEYRGRRS